ncbi:MAG TPA: carboxypeptidase regulatory-like domain-containing protein [Steroidobacteraceae bacterium]
MFGRTFPAATLLLLLLCLRTVNSFGANLVVSVQTREGRALAGAVVTLHVLGASNHPGPPVHAIMDQVDRAFVPDLLVLPVNSTVAFPNSDSVSHQIYSFSAAKRFQLPLYRGTPYPPVQFDQIGLVTLGCNIHDSMLAYVVVTDAPYFGRTDAAGAWSAEVPPGNYRITVWHPRMQERAALERDLTLGESDRSALTLRLANALQLAPLQERHHSWDAY